MGNGTSKNITLLLDCSVAEACISEILTPQKSSSVSCMNEYVTASRKTDQIAQIIELRY